jgi:hypothetical protein
VVGACLIVRDSWGVTRACLIVRDSWGRHSDTCAEGVPRVESRDLPPRTYQAGVGSASNQGQHDAGSDVPPPTGAAPSPTNTPTVDDQPSHNVLRREGDYWSLSFEGHTVALRDLKGLHYLRRLLANPGHEFHVLDLLADGVAPPANPTGVSDPELTSSGWGDSGLLLDNDERHPRTSPSFGPQLRAQPACSFRSLRVLGRPSRAR